MYKQLHIPDLAMVWDALVTGLLSKTDKDATTAGGKSGLESQRERLMQVMRLTNHLLVLGFVHADTIMEPNGMVRWIMNGRFSEGFAMVKRKMVARYSPSCVRTYWQSYAWFLGQHMQLAPSLQQNKGVHAGEALRLLQGAKVACNQLTQDCKCVAERQQFQRCRKANGYLKGRELNLACLVDMQQQHARQLHSWLQSMDDTALCDVTNQRFIHSKGKCTPRSTFEEAQKALLHILSEHVIGQRPQVFVCMRFEHIRFDLQQLALQRDAEKVGQGWVYVQIDSLICSMLWKWMTCRVGDHPASKEPVFIRLDKTRVTPLTRKAMTEMRNRLTFPSKKSCLNMYEARHYHLSLVYIYWYNGVHGLCKDTFLGKASATFVPNLNLQLQDFKTWMTRMFNTTDFKRYIMCPVTAPNDQVPIHPLTKEMFGDNVLKFLQQQCVSARSAFNQEDDYSDEELPEYVLVNKRKNKRKRRRRIN